MNQIDLNKIYNKDCLEGMIKIPDKSIDCIICDPPYGVTCCNWDKVIPFDKLWDHYKRIIKENGVILLFGTEPFASNLRLSNQDWYRYDWVWIKSLGANPFLCKRMPLKVHETISVFYRTKSELTACSFKFLEIRNYFQSELKRSGLKKKEINSILGNKMSRHYFTNDEQFTFPTKKDYTKLQETGYFQKEYDALKNEYEAIASSLSVTFNPQMSKGILRNKKPATSGTKKDIIYNGSLSNYNGKDNINDIYYPKSYLSFSNANQKVKIHPTQKPVTLIEYFIRTYTNEGEIVLDNCMGSGTTAVACINTSRKFIGFEIDKEYYNASLDRIKNVLSEPKLAM